MSSKSESSLANFRSACRATSANAEKLSDNKSEHEISKKCHAANLISNFLVVSGLLRIEEGESSGNHRSFLMKSAWKSQGVRKVMRMYPDFEPSMK
jgi:hypothetical protein